MSAIEHPPAADEAPLDRRLDRRAFLSRVAAASAGVAAVGAAASEVAAAAPSVGLVDVPVRPADVDDLTELTLAQAATLIRRGRLEPIDLVDAYLERIEAYDGTYKAFNTVLAEDARATARRLGRQRPRGALFGVPMAIKDNYYTAGVRTTANSYIYADFVPSFDATVVERLVAQGAIVLGKTQMGPLATTRATTPDGVITTVNAWTPNTPAVNPGGSSTGSATSVAGRLAASSVGTQTGGSITGPSNAQGLTGLKPTMGRVSLYGIVPLSYTRDHPGPLARDALDAALMTAAIAGADPDDGRTQGLPPVPDLVRAATPVRRGGRVRVRYRTRLGVLPGYTDGGTPDAAGRTAMLSALAGAGVDVVEVPLPEEWDLLTGTAFNNVRLPERTEPFLEYLKQDLKLFGVSLNGWMQGLFMSGDEWIKGQRAKLLLLERVLDDLFSRCDVVVQTSPVPFDIIGLPEIAFPIGFTPEPQSGRDIPLGAILGGQPYAEDRLLAVAAAYQAVTDWHTRRPADPAPAAAAARARSARAAGALRLTAEEVEEQMQ